MKSFSKQQNPMLRREQAIAFLESLLFAAVAVTLSIGGGLLHKNDSDSEDLESSCIEVIVSDYQETSQHAYNLNHKISTTSEFASEVRQVGSQGVVYADLRGALCNNLATIFCRLPYGPTAFTLYSKSMIGNLTVTDDKDVIISQKFYKCGSIFQLPEDGGNMQVYGPSGQCNLGNLYLTVDNDTKQLKVTENSKDATEFILREPTTCPGLQIQC